MKYNKLIIVMAMLALVSPIHATTLSLSQNGLTLFNSTGTAMTGNFAAKFGFWTSGFTPTEANLTSWDENFVAFNGYFQSANSRFLIAATVGDSAVSSNPLTSGQTGFIGAGSQTGATGFGAAFASNQPLSLLVSNASYSSAPNTNAGTNANYLIPSVSAQYALLSDAAWKVPLTAGALDTSTITFGFSANTTATFGSVSFSGGTGSVSLVPEPSTGALMMIGAVGLVALRRLRKV
jgi:PEP-CTERM motif